MKQAIYRLFNYFHYQSKSEQSNHIELATIRKQESLVIGFSFVTCLMVLMMFVALYFSPGMTPHRSIFLLLLLAVIYFFLPFLLKYTPEKFFLVQLHI